MNILIIYTIVGRKLNVEIIMADGQKEKEAVATTGNIGECKNKFN